MPDALGWDVWTIVGAAEGETLSSLTIGGVEVLSGPYTVPPAATDTDVADGICALIGAGYAAANVGATGFMGGGPAGSVAFTGTLATNLRIATKTAGWNASSQTLASPQSSLYGIKTGVPESYADSIIWGEFKQLPDAEAIVSAIDHAATQVPIDPDRIYVTGISAGARMTHRVVSDYPGRFAACAAVAGGFPLVLYDPASAFHKQGVRLPWPATSGPRCAAWSGRPTSRSSRSPARPIATCTRASACGGISRSTD